MTQLESRGQGVPDGLPGVQAASDDIRALLNLRGAAGIADTVMRKAVTNLEAGVQEEIHAARIYKTVESLKGTPAESFPLVSFGASTACVEHESDQTELAYGDTVVISFACLLDGRPTELARTLFFGDVDEPRRIAYGEVLRVAQAAYRHCVEGATTSSIRALIAEQLGEALPDCVVEAPSPSCLQGTGGMKSLADDITLAEGQLLYVGIGVHVDGAFGIRLANTVLVTDYGCEVLNRYPLSMSILDASKEGE